VGRGVPAEEAVRDLRDPALLGKKYLQLRGRKRRVSIATAVKAEAPPYRDGGYISNDPALHHSRTPQTKGDLTT